MNIWLAAIIVVVVGGLALAGSIFILRHILRKHASRTWPEAVGKITEGNISLSHDSNDNSIYSAQFTFTYHVLGSMLSGQSASRNLNGSWNYAKRSIADHPIGTTIRVRYNPEKPEEYFSEFEWGNTQEWFWFILLFILFISILAVFVVNLVQTS
jgi:hypothetical protein